MVNKPEIMMGWKRPMEQRTLDTKTRYARWIAEAEDGWNRNQGKGRGQASGSLSFLSICKISAVFSG
jgi:hypothetical protein